MSKNADQIEKFSYQQAENADAVFNYLSMVNKGIKHRHLSLGETSEMLSIDLPDQVELSIKAQSKGGKGSLSISISWEAATEVNEDERPEVVSAAEQDEKDAKDEKKAEKAQKKAEKEALKALEKEDEKARKQEKKAAKKLEKKLEKETDKGVAEADAELADAAAAKAVTADDADRPKKVKAEKDKKAKKDKQSEKAGKPKESGETA